MTRRIPISIVYQLDRNNDEPVELLVRATVLPPEERRTTNREAPSIDFDAGSLVELDDDGEELGEWQGRLTHAEEAELDRAVLAAWEAEEKECA